MRHQTTTRITNSTILFILVFVCFNMVAKADNSVRISNKTQQLQTNNEWQTLIDKAQFDRVINTSSAILQIDNNNQDALFYQALALHLSNQQDQAKALFHQILNQHQQKSSHISLFRVGMCHFYLGQLAKSIVAFKHHLKTDNADAQTYKMLGYALARNNQHQAALEAFNQVLNHHQDHSIYYNRGLVHFALKDWKSAAQDMKRSIEQKPKFDLPYYNLVTIYVLMEQPKQALMWLNTLLSQRITNLTRLQQDPALTQFIQSENYVRLLKRYKLDSEPH